MYLSRLKLDPLSRTTRELRLNPYLLHQAVFRAFPDEADGGAGRVLYRLDIERKGNNTLLVQSEKEPDWEQSNMLKSCLLEGLACKPISFSFVEGQTFSFRLRANPTVKRATADEPERTRRLGLLKEEDQLTWLRRKAGACGFFISTCRVIPEGMVRDERGKGDGKLRHYGVRFEGVLSVVNPELFEAAVRGGIGPAKGFGFGLLSLARIKE